MTETLLMCSPDGVFGPRLIALTPDEGRLFCANAVNIGRSVVMNAPTPRLAGILADAGFTVVATQLTEFMKSSGSAKCLTLRIAWWRPAEQEYPGLDCRPQTQLTTSRATRLPSSAPASTSLG